MIQVGKSDFALKKPEKIENFRSGMCRGRKDRPSTEKNSKGRYFHAEKLA
jgi:hypothetical protein